MMMGPSTLNTNNGDTSTATTDGAESPEAASPQQAPMPSGLSALILAATSQLGHLADIALNEPSLTPPIVEERAHLNFPETLMTLCQDPSNVDTIAFLPDGKFFAIRQSTFCKQILNNEEKCFFEGVTKFCDFIDLCEKWGFSRIGQDDIIVLRHPKFKKGEFDLCTRIAYGVSSQDIQKRNLKIPSRTAFGASGSNISRTRSQQDDEIAQPKRRLSPGFLARRHSLDSVSSRQRTGEFADLHRAKGLPSTPILYISDEDLIHNVALSITSDKLKIEQPEPGHSEEAPLVDSAVTSATHEIVTGAIKSLLRDESHSTKTFLKHEKELSRSSVPGVVPVCKQLFSPTYKETDTNTPTNVVGAEAAKDKCKPAHYQSKPASRVVTSGSEVEESTKLPPQKSDRDVVEAPNESVSIEMAPLLSAVVLLDSSTKKSPTLPGECTVSNSDEAVASAASAPSVPSAVTM